MTNGQMIGAVVGAIIAVLIILFAISRINEGAKGSRGQEGKRKPSSATNSVQIAHLIERPPSNASDGYVVALLILGLIGFSLLSCFRYFTATNASDQIIALLMWIGNCAFWGIFILCFVMSRTRTYVVYRDIGPSTGENRREPGIFARE